MQIGDHPGVCPVGMLQVLAVGTDGLVENPRNWSGATLRLWVLK